MEPVPQQFVRFLIKKDGADNFRVIENKCGVKIFWPKISGTEKHVIFTIKGLKLNLQRAQEMLRANLVSILFLLVSGQNSSLSCNYIGSSGGQNFTIKVSKLKTPQMF